MNLFQNAAFGWAFRRAQELGGIIGLLASIYAAMRPDGKDAVNRVFAGSWQNVSLG